MRDILTAFARANSVSQDQLDACIREVEEHVDYRFRENSVGTLVELDLAECQGMQIGWPALAFQMTHGYRSWIVALEQVRAPLEGGLTRPVLRLCRKHERDSILDWKVVGKRAVDPVIYLRDRG